MSTLWNKEVAAFQGLIYTYINGVSFRTSHGVRNNVEVRISGVSKGVPLYIQYYMSATMFGVTMDTVTSVMSSRVRERSIKLIVNNN